MPNYAATTPWIQPGAEPIIGNLQKKKKRSKGVGKTKMSDKGIPAAKRSRFGEEYEGSEDEG